MDRREWMGASLALASAGLALGAGNGVAAEHEHHHHHDATKNNPYGELGQTAMHCVLLGEACLDHCLDLLGQGDKSLAACAKSVEPLLAICNALRQLSTYQSPHVPKLAKLALEICKTCETECRKHKEHEPCRQCADACAECARECGKFAV